MEAQIVNREAFTVLGLKYRGQNETGEEIPQLWRDLAEKLEAIENPLDPKTACGIVNNYDEETTEFDYVAGVEVKEGHHVPLGMTMYEIPEQTWAIFRCTSDQLDEMYRAIYETWLPQSDYQRAEGPELEEYDPSFLGDEKIAQVSIHIPIKEI